MASIWHVTFSPLLVFAAPGPQGTGCQLWLIPPSHPTIMTAKRRGRQEDTVLHPAAPGPGLGHSVLKPPLSQSNDLKSRAYSCPLSLLTRKVGWPRTRELGYSMCVNKCYHASLKGARKVKRRQRKFIFSSSAMATWSHLLHPIIYIKCLGVCALFPLNAPPEGGPQSAVQAPANLRG